MSENHHHHNISPLAYKSRRRSSIAAGPTLEVTPEYLAIERSSAYNDFAALTDSAKLRNRRRNSLDHGDKNDLETRFRRSLASMMEYQGQSISVQKLKEKFERRGSLLSADRMSARSSVIGSVVDTTKSGNEEFSDDDISARESISMPLTEVRQPRERPKNTAMNRELIIESLVNFSYHTPCAVLEDLIKHELQLWEDHHNSKTTADNLSDDNLSAGSLSTLSCDGKSGDALADYEESEKSWSQQLARSTGSFERNLIISRPSLPNSRKRECALLFVDINGFTKLSTMLDVESLSKVINSYFEMIVNEVIAHGGDILKFAGDAFFAEWRVENDEDSIKGPEDLRILNASLSSSQDFASFSSSNSRPAIVSCVWKAAKCATSIVKKFSDYQVPVTSDSSFNPEKSQPSEAMLNVHCGIGTGNLVGLHVGDYKEDDSEEAHDESDVELRREFLFLGDVIDQVSRAAHVASDGEVMASPEALEILSYYCDIPEDMILSTQPQMIASRCQSLISLKPEQTETSSLCSSHDEVHIPLHQNLRRHCKHLQQTALARLHLQMALYVHPVVRGDELSRSKRGTVVMLDAPQDRHLAEAELRSVYTMFVKALVSPRTTGDPEIDAKLFKILGSIMHVTSRELDRYSGQLRQFIVDDKGVVLIATFGLRGSTFPNMITNNALPATLDIHQALKEELGVENRIGATFGQVYCGVVGGIRRHEFSVLGAAVNLAARLMESPMNDGVLVDEAVKSQADSRYEFRSLQPIKAKGYEKPVTIFEPLRTKLLRKRGSTLHKFTGRREERNEILGFACEILDDPTSVHGSVINLIGESGIGKSALGTTIMSEVKQRCLSRKKRAISLRSTSTESEQRIPLCAFRKVFLAAIRELCLQDGSIAIGDDKPEAENQGLIKSYHSDGIDTDTDDDDDQDPRNPKEILRSNSFTQQLRARRERILASSLHLKQVRGAPNSRGSSRRGMYKGGSQMAASFSSLPRARPLRRGINSAACDTRENFASMGDVQNRPFNVPYLAKLYWACDCIGYPHEYADLVGSQFLGLESPHPVTHINGEVPVVSELVEFVAQAFMKITDHADLVLVFIDDFQWVDSFTWKVIRALGQSGKNMLLLCAMRSHDKQAMRRMATAVNFRLEITLGPLDLLEIRELACTVLGYTENAIDDFVCSEIYQKTGGLPVYVIELLEGIKRNNSVYQDQDGKMRINDVALMADREGNSALLESLLNRFDALDVRVRKILQTCAVLGNSFALSDLVRVHPELTSKEIELSLGTATAEMILVEILDEDEDSKSVLSNSTGESSSKFCSSIEFSKTSAGMNVVGDRYFEFSHDMWMSNVLTTMLKERKIELHRRIAETMEKEQVYILQRNDIGRLLTLFDHWKSCGDFRKAAPLALVVGTRLNEWDLTSQSLELYQDAYGMCYECIEPVDEQYWRSDDEWVKVTSNPDILDLILRLHLRIGECHKEMGDYRKGLTTLQDAFKISTSVPGPCALKLPILSKLCSIMLDLDDTEDDSLREQESLIDCFIQTAEAEADPVHLARALSMEAAFCAQQGNLKRALHDLRLLQNVYKIEQHAPRMIQLYDKDYAAECFSQGILWYFISGQEEEASKQAYLVVQKHLPYQDPQDIDSIMALVLPAVLIFKFVGRAAEADYIVKRFVINAHHDLAPYATYWVEMFNPICYLLEIVKMDDCDRYDIHILDEIQGWVMHEVNSYFSPIHLRLGHTLMGEICFRLAHLKPANDPMRYPLLHKARSFLTPIARDTYSEPFLAYSALRFLKAM